MDSYQDFTGQCWRCCDETYWINDPAPDLCARCAVGGAFSALWSQERQDEYRDMIIRLLHERKTRG